MPTYEYECKQCGYRFEKFQKMSDQPLKKCPECGGPVQRLISSGGGIILKGDGFYKNDYSNQTRCGKDQTCCGRDIPCDKPPCE
jgi:putative FmdB family regulatory protein